MIELRNVTKEYGTGPQKFYALKDISLTIEDGEFISIMGPSGSGKSTLMNILGLLDSPDSGSYSLNGREVSGLSDDELSSLRRKEIGFVFQQFNLLPRISTLANVTLPLLYSREKSPGEPARTMLARVGLGARLNHRPNQLSGGEQQRAAIARALINNPRVILADEPTGNLDSKTADEIVSILTELNRQGITVIIVTHEEDIGRRANRRIMLKDGKVVLDEKIREGSAVRANIPPQKSEKPRLSALAAEFSEHLAQGFRSLLVNKVRTALSMLGILIGVGAVVAMLALGRGAQKAIEAQLSSLGSNLILIRPGSVRMGGIALETGAATRLTLEDAAALKNQLSSARDTSPAVMGRGQIAYLNKNWNSLLYGAAPSYELIRNSRPARGRFFTEAENRSRSRVAVVGLTVIRQLFEDQDPLGELIKINRISFRIIGILPERGATGFRDQDDIVVVPVLTAMRRVMGKDYVDSIDLEAKSAEVIPEIQKDAMSILIARHRVPPSQRQDAFEIRSMAEIQKALSTSSTTMGYLLAAIAAISLLVGGIGIMNIMLVSVAERTREVGLRKAIGAKAFDILLQFLAESVVISGLGGLLGIIIGWGASKLISTSVGWATAVSTGSVLLAFFFSTSVGIVFGIYPARKASLLNPIQALRYE